MQQNNSSEDLAVLLAAMVVVFVSLILCVCARRTSTHSNGSIHAIAVDVESGSYYYDGSMATTIDCHHRSTSRGTNAQEFPNSVRLESETHMTDSDADADADADAGMYRCRGTAKGSSSISTPPMVSTIESTDAAGLDLKTDRPQRLSLLQQAVKRSCTETAPSTSDSNGGADPSNGGDARMTPCMEDILFPTADPRFSICTRTKHGIGLDRESALSPAHYARMYRSSAFGGKSQPAVTQPLRVDVN